MSQSSSQSIKYISQNNLHNQRALPADTRESGGCSQPAMKLCDLTAHRTDCVDEWCKNFRWHCTPTLTTWNMKIIKLFRQPLGTCDGRHCNYFPLSRRIPSQTALQCSRMALTVVHRNVKEISKSDTRETLFSIAKSSSVQIDRLQPERCTSSSWQRVRDRFGDIILVVYLSEHVYLVNIKPHSLSTHPNPCAILCSDCIINF